MENGFSVTSISLGFDPAFDDAVRSRVPDETGSGFGCGERDHTWDVATQGDVDKLREILFAEFPQITAIRVFQWAAGKIAGQTSYERLIPV